MRESQENKMERLCRPLRDAAWQVEAEAALQQLVEISSHSHDRAGCQATAEALCQLFDMPGLSVSRHPDPGGRQGDHVCLRSAAAAGPDAPPFPLLIGHLDTVFPASVFAGYRVSEEGGVRRAHGPGVYDMKGGLVAIAFALRALSEADLLGEVALRGVIVSDEEIGSPTSKGLIVEVGRGASCALGFESGRVGDAIITRRKGLGALVVRARGQAAHAGNAHAEGKNAIWGLCRFVAEAQELTDYDRGITINVGRIAGGHGRNVVPAEAEAEVDFRFIQLADAAGIEQALRQAAERAALPGVSLSVSGGVTRLPLCRTAASERLYERYARCQRAAGLDAAEAPLLGGGSDASSVAPLGIPAIDGLGPRGSDFHTVKEQVELRTLLPKAEALLRFLCAPREDFS